MSEWLNQLGEWFKQAWVYIPMILSFITAIGLPSLVQIAKIFSSARLYLTQVKTLKEKLNVAIETTNQTNKVCGFLMERLEEDVANRIEFLELQLVCTYNKKMQEVIRNEIEKLKARLQEYKNITIGQLIELVSDRDLQPKKVVKVKVKK